MVSDERKDRISEDKIGVVIVTFNNEKTIKPCLQSISKYDPRSKIVVVDNNSQDKTCQIIEQFGNKVSLIKSETNLGFAKANNLGFKNIPSEYVVFLNPDTQLLTPGSLGKMGEALENNPDFGLIGPQLVLPDGSIQKSVRRLPSVVGAVKEYVLGVKGSYDFYDPHCQTLCEVESVVGACMMVKRGVFERVEMFDESYFLYYEDLALCRVVRSLGIKVGYLPQIKIQHLVGESGQHQPVLKYLHLSAKKYHGLVTYYLIQSIIRIGGILHPL